MRLVVAGPAWEPEYVERIEADFRSVVERVGEVGGAERSALISGARAVLVLSQSVPGPWGHLWSEPGATVVSEAAISGTPVIATRNGCLPDLVPGVGALVGYGSSFTAREAEAALSRLPAPAEVREVAMGRWHYRGIAERYEELYRRVIAGGRWGHTAAPAGRTLTSTPGSA
jgi:glycosyltransferase involved in cell wall biosynthesis